ncbi:MAG: phosphatidate cytidylyltransferase [Clostridia bacterium]|nr:phosphatidate cytidylyltransferase [Clostridia bacterium]
MKTRIISGIVMGAIVAAVLVVGYLWAPVVITLAVAALAAAAVYELLHNAAGIKSKAVIIGACVYAALAIVGGAFLHFEGVVTATVLYCVYAVVMVLVNHKELDLGKIAVVYALPVPFAVAFYFLQCIINAHDGIYYLLLLLNFSSICDMGAYFVGVTLGKHKLCPEISPKKTVEGAIGGIVSSVIITLVISLLFKKFSIAVLILTIPLCVLGMIGDLFASAIKRSVGLKDYSNLIPGHGGIMDRLDSIIMIAPTMFVLVGWGII